MKNINITALSDSPQFINLVMGDCINISKKIFEEIGYSVFLTNNTFAEGCINIAWGVASQDPKNYSAYREMAKKFNTIFMNMEQLGSNSPIVTTEYLKLLHDHKFFDYHISNILEIQKKYGPTSAHEFPLIPDRAIQPGNIEFHEKKFDFAFFGLINDRRQKIINDLRANGHTIKIINGAYLDELSEELKECKSVLNIHYYESSLFEVARCLRPVSIEIPIISENSALPVSINWEDSGIFFTEYEKLTEASKHFLKKNNLIALQKKSNQFKNNSICKTKIEDLKKFLTKF
jgi:hypothetical protein